jgi:hypothetical protein
MTLERLGASEAFGETLLGLLAASGWQIVRPSAFAGEGVLLIARQGDIEQRASGDNLAEAANALLQEIGTYWPSLSGHDQQLRLFVPAIV